MEKKVFRKLLRQWRASEWKLYIITDGNFFCHYFSQHKKNSPSMRSVLNIFYSHKNNATNKLCVSWKRDKVRHVVDGDLIYKSAAKCACNKLIGKFLLFVLNICCSYKIMHINFVLTIKYCSRSHYRCAWNFCNLFNRLKNSICDHRRRGIHCIIEIWKNFSK
jgi:hypothetical protein